MNLSLQRLQFPKAFQQRTVYLSLIHILLKALYGPYREIKFMPTGGISPSNAADYLRQPNVIACGGSWLCSEQDILREDWAAVETSAREAAELVRSVQNAAS